MIEGVPRALTLIGAAGAGVAAGFCFAFSAVAMRALDRLPPAEGVSAVLSIKRAAPASFVAAFLGTALVCAALAVEGFRQLDEPWSVYLLVGAALDLASIVLTFAFHTPRDDACDLVDPDGPRAADAWAHHFESSTVSSRVRTLTSLGGAVAFRVAFRVR
jgi:uncharacterized membrane protein